VTSGVRLFDPMARGLNTECWGSAREFDPFPLFLQEGRDVKRGPDPVSDQQVATPEQLVEFHIEVVAAQNAFDPLQSAHCPTDRYRCLPARGLLDLASDAVPGEVAPDARGVIGASLPTSTVP